MTTNRPWLCDCEEHTLAREQAEDSLRYFADQYRDDLDDTDGVIFIVGPEMKAGRLELWFEVFEEWAADLTTASYEGVDEERAMFQAVKEVIEAGETPLLVQRQEDGEDLVLVMGLTKLELVNLAKGPRVLN